MVSSAVGAISILLMVFVTLALPVVLVWLAIKLFQGLAFVLAALGRGLRFFVVHVFTFFRSTVLDALGLVGGVLTAVVLLPLSVFNVMTGRWSAARHYGGALEDELQAAGLSLYRLALGNPIRLLGLGVLTEGIERRLPEIVMHAPAGGRRPKKGFPGYKITGQLKSGGSGGRLFLAEPKADKRELFAAHGHVGAGKVVIKSFDLEAGSTLPQIVRESRALEAARGLGLVLDHELSPKSFWYAMPYVPGDDLSTVTRRLHERAGQQGLTDEQMALALGYAGDLLQTLDRFHRVGLWHKDIKPSNVIVSGGRAHLVDLGLVTPLQSAMTLTTHGTEYFRDPEMVRLAMRGVRVHEVDGVKFDVYSAGAVLYAMLENSFPAHGSLSRLSKRCPEALKWIIRRAMADLESRYPTARAMLADLRAVACARDPFAVKPAELPSISGVGPGLGGAAVPRPAAFAADVRPGPAPIFGAPATEPGGRPAVARRKRRKVAAAALAFLFSAVLAATFVHAWREDRMAAAHAEHVYSLGQYSRGLEQHLGDAWSQNLEEVLGHYRHLTGETAVPERASRAVVADAPSGPWTGASDVRPACAGRVLILNDLPPATGEDVVDELLQVLEERRFTVLGCSTDLEGEEGAREIELLAELRKTVGVGDPRADESLARLQAFVASSGEVDAVLWLAPGEQEKVYWRLVALPE